MRTATPSSRAGGLVFWFVKNDTGFWRGFGWCGFLLCLLILIKTQTATATVAVMAALAAIAGFNLFRRYRFSLGTFLVATLVIMLPIAFLMLFASELFFEAIGRDPTLTHRTRLWGLATSFAMENHPWLGSGFRAFWTDTHSAPVRFLLFGSRQTDYGNGHSGYVDLWLELGVPGTLGFALILLTALARSLYLFLYHPDSRVLFFPAFIVFILLYSVTEKVYLEHTEIASITLMIVIMKMTWLCAHRSDADSGNLGSQAGWAPTSNRAPTALT